MSKKIEAAKGLPKYSGFQTLNMNFNAKQTWEIVSLGADKDKYGEGNSGDGSYPVQAAGDLKAMFGPLEKAAKRAVTDPSEFSDADFLHILHPNGICLAGQWVMDAYDQNNQNGDLVYTGQFRPGTIDPMIVRASAFGSYVDVNSGWDNSFGFVGRIFLGDTNESADFITQTDLGGVPANSFFESDAFNTPPVSPLNRHRHIRDLEVIKFFQSGVAFRGQNPNNSNRQVYTIAELGKGKEPTHTPRFIKFVLSHVPHTTPPTGKDFRKEIRNVLHELKEIDIDVQVSEGPLVKTVLFGIKPAKSAVWHHIGWVKITDSVVSYACDFRLNIKHPPWRCDVNDPGTEVTPGQLRVCL